MTSDVPWQVEGVRREVIETAREAARRSGISVAQWLDNVIVESAADAGMNPSGRKFGRLPLSSKSDNSHLDGASDIPERNIPIDQALAEIEARRRALDGEAPGPQIEPARASTQHPLDLERELRQINARIETLRPCRLDNAIETLRDDLAEIGLMLKDAMPRQAIEALETEVRSLVSRVDDKRHAGVDGADVAGIEIGLAEIRDALRRLTPAESITDYDEAVQNLAHKIEDLSGDAQDPDTLRQLEGAIAALRGVVSHVASDGALAKLSEEVRSLSIKVDQVVSADAFSIIERRIAAIADALQSRSHSAQGLDAEAVASSLAEKFERLQLSRADHTAVAHLEDRIVGLVEKLNASDARSSQLATIERGLADLLVHLESQRSPPQGAAAPWPETDELKHDVQRTQDSLEAVHGTLGHVVDRLATIETTMRGPVASQVATRPVPPAVPTSMGPPTVSAATAEAHLEQPIPVPSPNPPPVPSASSNPAPAQDRRPIDPNLPPDHPIEPGAARARSSPADRIAASQAALGNARPPVIPDPGGKSNFIAAARRAAQAAIVEAPPPKEKPGQATAGRSAAASIANKIGGMARKLLVGAGVGLLVIGSVHFAATRLWRSANELTAQAIPEDSAPSTAIQAPVSAPAPVAAPERQSAVLPFVGTSIPGTLPVGPNTAFAPPPAIDADVLATGTVRPPPTQIATVPVGTATSPPLLPPPTPARPDAADRLPPGIGSSALRAAAVKGDAAAAFEIASRYAEGHGVPQNLAEAAAWFERAARKGIVPAQFRLGGLYEKGLGIPKNLDTARRHYLAAAEAGNGKAMHNLAVLYSEGIDGRPDYAIAARWFRKAAEQGIVDSQYNLAVLYLGGIGVEANLAEAFKWFALASRDGDREAARKRDDVAARLDRQSLAAAMKEAQSWQPQPQPQAAIQVRVPTGGWDAEPTPAVAKRAGGPKIDTRPHRPAQ